MKFTPREHQIPILNAIKSKERVLISASMGSGKTISTLMGLLEFNTFPIVIVAPLRVAKFTWPDEIKKWDETRHLNCRFVGGSAQKFERELKKGIAEGCQIYTINYESVHLLAKYKVPILVLDESTKVKSYRTRQGGKRAKILYKIAKKSKRVVLLTGTITPNGMEDIWGQMAFIDHGFRLESSFHRFRQKYFNAISVGKHRMAVKYELKPRSESEIINKIKDVVVKVDVRDYLDINEPIVRNVSFDLPKNAQKAHDDFKIILIEQLKKLEEVENIHEHKRLKFNALSKVNLMLQVCSGQVYDTDGHYEIYHDMKLQILESIVEEFSGEPILVSYNFVSEADRILNHFKHAQKLDKNPNTITKWNKGEIKMLVAHPASCGHGLNLAEGGHILVHYGITYNLELYLQINERLGPLRQKQAGLDREVYIYHIIANNSIEADKVLPALNNKESKMDSFIKQLEGF